MRPLEEGDSVNIDITLFKYGVHGDNSVMVKLGKVHSEVEKLIDMTQLALYESIRACKSGEKISTIGEICFEVEH